MKPVSPNSKNQMTNFASLRNRDRKSKLDDLAKQLEKTETKWQPDERIWTPTYKDGYTYALIRFLPKPENEESCLVKVYSYFFRGMNGQYYIENSPKTIGKECPIQDLWSKLYNGTEADKKEAERYKRSINYYSNIYVIKDPNAPNNEGKVFIYKYGQVVYKMISSMLKPNAADPEDPVDVFDLWTGCDFKLKLQKEKVMMKDGKSRYMSKYNNCTFNSPSVLGDFDDEELEEIYNKEYSLEEFLDPKNYKSYDALLSRFKKVMDLDNDEETDFYTESDTAAEVKSSFNPETPTFGSVKMPETSFDIDQTALDDYEKILEDE